MGGYFRAKVISKRDRCLQIFVDVDRSLLIRYAWNVVIVSLLAKFGTDCILFMVVEISAGIPLPHSIKVKSNHQVYEPT